MPLQVDDELLSQLERGGNINLLIDSSIFTPKSSTAPLLAVDDGSETTRPPEPPPVETAVTIAQPPTGSTAVTAPVPPSLPAVSPAELEGRVALKREKNLPPDQGKILSLLT